MEIELAFTSLLAIVLSLAIPSPLKAEINNYLLPSVASPSYAHQLVDDHCAQSKYVLTPDNLIIQTAGYVGFIAIGLGWGVTKNSQFSLLAGYVPKSVAGIELWQLSAKFDWYVFEKSIINMSVKSIHWHPFYLGLGLTYGIHDDLWVQLPDRYPDEYYQPTAFRFLLNFGSKFSLRHYDVIFGYSLFDIEVFEYINSHEFYRKNYSFFGLAGIGSLSLAIELDW